MTNKTVSKYTRQLQWFEHTGTLFVLPPYGSFHFCLTLGLSVESIYKEQLRAAGFSADARFVPSGQGDKGNGETYTSDVENVLQVFFSGDLCPNQSDRFTPAP